MRVIVVQLAVCAVLLAGAFLMVKTNPNAQQALREAYDNMLSQDWTMQDAAAAFKQIGSFIFAPADTWPEADVSGETNAAQANAPAEETMRVDEPDPTQNGTQEADSSAETSGQAGEATSREELNGMGGTDETLFEGVRAPVSRYLFFSLYRERTSGPAGGGPGDLFLWISDPSRYQKAWFSSRHGYCC